MTVEILSDLNIFYESEGKTMKETRMNYKTLGDLIASEFSDFEIWGGQDLPMDMDISHGADVEVYDNTKWGHGISATIHPYILWTDGLYKPCYFYGGGKCVYLQKR